MRSDNDNEAITNLAIPERRIPVLIASGPEKAEGFVPSIVWSDKPITSVRTLQPSFVEGLKNPSKRREIEKEHGTISAIEWNRLRELLDLKDRLNAGDWSSVVKSNAKDVLRDFPALLDRLSPGRWFLEEDKSGTDKRTYKSLSGDMRFSVSFEIGPKKPLSQSDFPGASIRKAAPPVLSDLGSSGPGHEWKGEISAEIRSATLALAEAFTAGLSKTRFVVWWSDIGKKFVPGLFCPDIVTALYALAMWSSGTTGGWAICQNSRCKKDYPRSRVKQRYCSHKCQVAAAMQRFRDRAKSVTPKEEKPAPRTKKHKGRK
jgi:hypothetical protein